MCCPKNYICKYVDWFDLRAPAFILHAHFIRTRATVLITTILACDTQNSCHINYDYCIQLHSGPFSFRFEQVYRIFFQTACVYVQKLNIIMREKAVILDILYKGRSEVINYSINCT